MLNSRTRHILVVVGLATILSPMVAASPKPPYRWIRGGAWGRDVFTLNSACLLVMTDYCARITRVRDGMVLGWIPDIRSGQMTINSSNAPVVIDRGTYTAFSRVRCLMPPDYYAYKEYDFTPFPQYSDTSGIWAVTKDGRYVIVDGRIMRISDGKFLDFTAQHPTASFFTGFTPDSKCAITNDRHILDIATGNYQALLGVSDQWNRPVISPDGAYYTARSGWNQTQALGIGTDTVAATLPFANDILFSNDMAHVFLNNIEVPGANDPDAGMFAFPSGNEIWRVTHKWGTVGDLSPDGSTVVLVPSPSIGPVELRDALTGTIKNRVQWFNLPPIAAFQRSGKFVAAVCDHDDVLPDAPNPVYVFDTTYGKELYTFNVTHHPSCLAFVGDGTLLVGSGVYPDSLAAYNWKTGALLWQKDYEEIASIQVTANQQALIATPMGDYLIDPSDGHTVKRPPTGFSYGVYSPNGKYVAWETSKSLTITDANFKPLVKIPCDARCYGVSASWFSDNRKLLAYGISGGWSVLDLTTGRNTAFKLPGQLFHMETAYDANQVMASWLDTNSKQHFALLDVRTMKPVWQCTENYGGNDTNSSGYVQQFRFSIDRKLVAVSTGDGCLAMLETPTLAKASATRIDSEPEAPSLR